VRNTPAKPPNCTSRCCGADPSGAKKFLSAAQATAVLASVRQRDIVATTCRRVAAELVADLEGIYARSKAADNTGRSDAIRLMSSRALRPKLAG
jgi:hypothetical protein